VVCREGHDAPQPLGAKALTHERTANRMQKIFALRALSITSGRSRGVGAAGTFVACAKAWFESRREHPSLTRAPARLRSPPIPGRRPASPSPPRRRLVGLVPREINERSGSSRSRYIATCRRTAGKSKTSWPWPPRCSARSLQRCGPVGPNFRRFHPHSRRRTELVPVRFGRCGRAARPRHVTSS